MNTNTDSCEGSDLHFDISSEPVTMAQSPAILSSPFHSIDRTRPVAHGDAVIEAANCQPRQQKNPQATPKIQRGMYHGPQQSFGLALSIDVPQHTACGPGVSVVRNLFGDSPSRAQLDKVFSKEQQQVCEHHFVLCYLALLLSIACGYIKLKLLLAVQSERQFKEKWNFDVSKEIPVSGRWRYDPASQQ